MSLEQIPLKRTMRRKSHLFRLAKWYFFTPQPVCVSRFPVKRQGRIPCSCCLAGSFSALSQSRCTTRGSPSWSLLPLPLILTPTLMRLDSDPCRLNPVYSLDEVT